MSNFLSGWTMRRFVRESQLGTVGLFGLLIAQLQNDGPGLSLIANEYATGLVANATMIDAPI